MVKNLPANAGDVTDACLSPVLGRPPGGGNGNLLQYSCLENFLDRGAMESHVLILVIYFKVLLWEEYMGKYDKMFIIVKCT